MSGETVPPETEAEVFARNGVAELEAKVWEPMPLTGHGPTDRSNQALRGSDQEIVRSLEGTGYLYFGHTVNVDGALYDSLMAGFKPDPEVVAVSRDDWLWDEILNLNQDHPDIANALSRGGYNKETGAPVVARFVGAYVISRAKLTEMLETLYVRGEEYRQANYGYPRIGDRPLSETLPDDIKRELIFALDGEPQPTALDLALISEAVLDARVRYAEAADSLPEADRTILKTDNPAQSARLLAAYGISEASHSSLNHLACRHPLLAEEGQQLVADFHLSAEGRNYLYNAMSLFADIMVEIDTMYEFDDISHPLLNLGRNLIDALPASCTPSIKRNAHGAWTAHVQRRLESETWSDGPRTLEANAILDLVQETAQAIRNVLDTGSCDQTKEQKRVAIFDAYGSDAPYFEEVMTRREDREAEQVMTNTMNF